MVISTFFFKSLFILWYGFFFRPLKCFRRTTSKTAFTNSQNKHGLKCSSLLHRKDLEDRTIVFEVEGALLKSSSIFSYFMLVAFEAGGLLRAILLLAVYPFVCLVGDEMRMKIMVMICFFGVKVETFRVGKAVLPKFLLEDVGAEMFEVVKKGGKKVGFSKMPQVMVESFLKEYLEIDFVVARELKVFHGFFVGLMEEENKMMRVHDLDLVREGKGCSSHIIGISGFQKDFDHSFSPCKEVYMVTEADKKSWQKLSRDKYPKPLIFHDGRLAINPTPLTTLAMIMWVPCGFILSLIRISIAFSLSYNISTPLLAFIGLYLTTSKPKPINTTKAQQKPKHHIYVCNHRTLLDPLYIAFALKKDIVAVTYSLSRMSEILAPIKTVRLTRNRDEDAKKMKGLLKEGDLVVCPEGTTCREPYLLRFSGLFAELNDEIVPVAIDTHVNMFYGTTAGGLKCLDPFFFLMNPFPRYSVQLLENVSTLFQVKSDEMLNENIKITLNCVEIDSNSSCSNNVGFEVANRVQKLIGKALGFECTKLNRKDKYLILADNEGIVSTEKCHK